MSFEDKPFDKEFPELDDKIVWAKDLIAQETFIRLSDVVDNCLSKQKVKEAIEKCKKKVIKAYEAEYGYPQDASEFDELEEELGLK